VVDVTGVVNRGIITSVLVLLALSPIQLFGYSGVIGSSFDAADTRLTGSADRSDAVAARRPTPPVVFGVYPDAGNGELGYVDSPEGQAADAALQALRGDKPFDVHLYTAWSWHDSADLDAKIERYTRAGLTITLTMKYSPPAGRDGDVDGYVDFVRSVVRRYRGNPAVQAYVIGNEANVTWGNPESSDGPFLNADHAVAKGIVAARRELLAIRSSAGVGTSMAIIEPGHDAAFVRRLREIGGRQFSSSLSFLGINVYPGLWPVGSGDPYQDMIAHLRSTRTALAQAGFGSAVTISVLENGFPTLDEDDQASRLSQMVQAVCAVAGETGVRNYSWFGMRDADSSSDNPYAHYGLLRSDLSAKPAFTAYQSLIQRSCR